MMRLEQNFSSACVVAVQVYPFTYHCGVQLSLHPDLHVCKSFSTLFKLLYLLTFVVLLLKDSFCSILITAAVISSSFSEYITEYYGLSSHQLLLVYLSWFACLPSLNLNKQEQFCMRIISCTLSLIRIFFVNYDNKKPLFILIKHYIHGYSGQLNIFIDRCI